MTPFRLVAALAFVALALPAAAQPSPQAHVEQVADGVAAHLPRLGQPPPVEIVLNDLPVAGVVDGRLEISTGLLSLLTSDAQLAMIIAYEQCRTLPREERRGKGSHGTSAAAQVGRAAAIGATTGAVYVGIDDAMQGSDPIVRGAVSGAAAASTGTAVAIAFSPRRHDRSGQNEDDAAAADGMRALVAAGWDGTEALRAWDRIVGAAPPPAEDGGYGDARANGKRREAAAKALKASGQRSTVQSGLGVGVESYRTEVLAGLAEPVAAPPEATDPRETPASPAPTGKTTARPIDPAVTWLVYRRSGGFTGWSAELRVDDDGTRWAAESQKRDPGSARPPLAPEAVQQLKEHVAAALQRPPRQASKDAGYLRDGLIRSIEVRAEGAWKSVALSDGLILTQEDLRLIEELEAALR